MKRLFTLFALCLSIASYAQPEQTVHARFVPERKDDFVWENKYTCYRAYGEALESGMISPGFDVWVKTPGSIICEELYHKTLTESDIYYHIDHGRGKDCYTVGISLGSGASAPLVDGQLIYPSTNFRSWEILSRSEDRIVFVLEYPAWEVDGKMVSLRKKFTVDADSYFCKVEDYYSGDFGQLTIAAGAVTHEVDSQTIDDRGFAFWEKPSETTFEKDDAHIGISVFMRDAEQVMPLQANLPHLVCTKTIKPGEKVEYWFGSCWEKGDIKSAEQWFEQYRKERGFTIHLMGDSTCAQKDLSKNSPERGWGMLFRNFTDESVKVVNYAKNGRSTKSFRDKGEWARVRDAIRPGDYVFIQFGHNDAKESDPERYAAAWGAYQDNLRAYIDTVRQKGGTPVLLTPCSRRWFKDGKLDRGCHGDYIPAMKQVAEQTGTTIIDIFDATADWLESLGDEGSKPYYMQLPAGVYASHPDGANDNTHTVARGARKIAEIICDSLKVRIPEIGEHLVHYDFIVDKDGNGDYRSVQQAIDAVPDFSHQRWFTILINPGVYKERVNIPTTKYRMLIKGRGAEETVIEYDNYAKKCWPDTDMPIGTSGSASLYIHSSEVTFEDLTIANTAGEGKEIGQAVALFTNGDHLTFRRCRFLGNQDTIYTYGHSTAKGVTCRLYFEDCYIEGTTDFIFGPSIAYFENCRIHSKKNSYITAASTYRGEKYGYVFHNCRLTADPGVTKVYLGRPWRPYAKTAFIECELGAHILPEGWHNWKRPDGQLGEKTSFYAEYGNTGPGSDTSKRVKWSHQLSARQAADYTFDKVMQDRTEFRFHTQK